MRRLGSTLLGLALLASCEDKVALPVEPIPPLTHEPHIELEGCAQRTTTQCWRPSSPPTQCERGPAADEPLRVWSDTPLEVRVDGGTALPRARRGAGFVWSVPPGEHEVELRHGPELVRALTVHSRLPEPPAVVRARREGVGRELEPLLKGFEPRVRLAALDLLTDELFDQARTASAASGIREHFDQLSEEAFRLSTSLQDYDHAACHTRRGLYVSLEHNLDSERARDWSMRLTQQRKISRLSGARNAYYSGLFARRFGETQAALESFERVEKAYEELGLPSDRSVRGARKQRAMLFASVGQPERALEILRDSNETSTTCADWLLARNNRVWSEILLEEGGLALDDPSPELEDIIQMMRDLPECYDEQVHRHATVNLGVANSRRGRLTRATEAFDLSQHLGVTELEEFVWIERVRIAIAAGFPAPPPLRPNTESALPADQWRRSFWKGRLAESLGDSEGAIVAYRSAEGVLSELAKSLRLDGGRESLLLQRQPSATRLVGLLLDAGRTEDAHCAARQARSRADRLLARRARVGALSGERLSRWREVGLRAEHYERSMKELASVLRLAPVDERAGLERKLQSARRGLSKARRDALEVLYGHEAEPSPRQCEELPTPGPSELNVFLFPLDEDQQTWSLFASRGSETIASRVQRNVNADHALELALNGEFAPLVDSATHIRFIPTAGSWSVRIATIPWRGRPLLEHAPITLALDLPTKRQHQPVKLSALVIGDPNKDLAAARAEASSIAQRLEAEGWDANTLIGDEATIEHLRNSVKHASLLHFAGHASAQGWQSRVQLNDDDRLSVSDIMRLDQVPALAILPACEVVAQDGKFLGGGMSVARSLLLSGARVVVGGTDKLDDEIARQVSEEFYAERIPQTAEDVTEALRTALLEVYERTRDPSVLNSFAVLTP